MRNLKKKQLKNANSAKFLWQITQPVLYLNSLKNLKFKIFFLRFLLDLVILNLSSMRNPG
jgi:hypothetical protein